MRPPFSAAPPLAVFAMAALLLLGCGEESTTPDTPQPTAPASTTSTTSTSVAPTTTAVRAVVVDATSFVNLGDMTAVRGFFVDNLLGDLEGTLAVAESLEGGVYPAGSVVQLFPGEAMVKREAGFSPETNDWEFFELLPSETGTEIRVRGGVEAVNSFGGSCAVCHSQAEPRFDFICEQSHGCDPLLIGRDLIEIAQETDPRPRTEGP